MECVVCLETAEEHITCSNRKCDSICCVPCFKEYISVSRVDQTIPKCVNPNCKCLYLYSNISSYPRLLQAYNDCCALYLMRDTSLDINKNLLLQQQIEMIRQNRMLFMSERFPAAIVYTASHFMKKKFDDIQKRTKLKLQQTTSTIKRCMRPTCPGTLNDQYVCNCCDAVFCKNCDRQKTSNHQCREEDVVSIEIITSLVKCPHCGVAIEKSSGCDSMTCTACHKHFNYKGGTSNYGNPHNQNHGLREVLVLSIEYKEQLSGLSLLGRVQELETYNVDVKDTKHIETLLMQYHREGPNTRLGNQISLEYEKIYLSKLKSANYHYIMEQIEQHLIKGSLTEYILAEYKMELEHRD